MTIDERLEYLLKSTESLHSNLQEMISETANYRAEHEKRWAEQEKRWAEQEKRWAEQEKRWREEEEGRREQDRRWEKNDEQIGKLTAVMAAMAATVIDHEKRLGER